MSGPDAVLDEPSDGALATRVRDRGGDPVAEAELCRRLGPRVRLFGRRHLADAQSADDLVQRVLWVVVDKLRRGEVRDPEQVASFALGTARRVASELRRGAPTVAFDEARHTELVEAPAPDPLAGAHVAAALAQLDDRERSVLVMTYYGDRSTGEIGEALGLSAGNVRVIRHRALRWLRDRLETP